MFLLRTIFYLIYKVKDNYYFKTSLEKNPETFDGNFFITEK